MASACNCANRTDPYLSTHECLHNSKCVLIEGPDIVAPSSVHWDPKLCPTCTLWITKLQEKTLNSEESDQLISLLKAIHRRRAKSRVAVDRQWQFFPASLQDMLTDLMTSSAAGERVNLTLLNRIFHLLFFFALETR